MMTKYVNNEMMYEISEGLPKWWSKRRYIAIKLKMRILDTKAPRNEVYVLHSCSDCIIDSNGIEYSSSYAGVKDPKTGKLISKSISAPNQMENRKIGWAIFVIPSSERIRKYQLAIDGSLKEFNIQAGEWRSD